MKPTTPNRNITLMHTHSKALAGFLLNCSYKSATVGLSGLSGDMKRPITWATKTMQTAYMAAIGNALGSSVYTNHKRSMGGGSEGGTYLM